MTDDIRRAWDNAIHPTIQEKIYEGLEAPEDNQHAELQYQCFEHSAKDAAMQVEAAKYRLERAKFELDSHSEEPTRERTEIIRDVSYLTERVAKLIDTTRYFKNAAAAYWHYLQ